MEPRLSLHLAKNLEEDNVRTLDDRAQALRRTRLPRARTKSWRAGLLSAISVHVPNVRRLHSGTGMSLSGL